MSPNSLRSAGTLYFLRSFLHLHKTYDVLWLQVDRSFSSLVIFLVETNVL